ncbi:MAG TPA: OmpA family protein [Polyangia bacterium]|jgi:chemotaxis protein MotB|nr:OmpA family protein [Polyangia bacterium]
MNPTKTIALLVTVVLAGGCGIDKEVYDAKVAELQKTQNELEQQRKDAAEAKRQCDERQAQLDNENLAMKTRLKALGQDISKMSGDMDAQKRQMAEMQKRQEAAEKRAQQFRDMMAKFRSMIDAGKLQVEVRNGLMLVKLPDNILFDPGKTEIKQAGKDAIAQVTQILSGIEGRKFQVAGHTDNIPIKSAKFKSNWELSTARAVEVTKLMIGDGMDPKRLSAAGFADELPIGDNSTDEGRRANRRIEIVVQPNIEDLPAMDDLNKPTS